jgi:hypothetical protein
MLVRGYDLVNLRYAGIGNTCRDQSPRRTARGESRRIHSAYVDSGLRPKASLGLAGFVLQLLDSLEILEGKCRVCEPVSLADNLGVHEDPETILPVCIGQGPPKRVPVPLIVVEADDLPLHEDPREDKGFLLSVSAGCAGILGLSGVDADQAHRFQPSPRSTRVMSPG